MSEVYSFRLDDKNPREAQAREVIDAWAKEGYSLRYIITEALLRLGNQASASSSPHLDTVIQTVERLSYLVDKLEEKNDCSSSEHIPQVELNNSFLASIKLAAKPGIKVVD